MKGFSALAGGLALGFMMIPLIIRTTEEMLLLVPNGYREAAFALGIARWTRRAQRGAQDRQQRGHHRRFAGLGARGRRDRRRCSSPLWATTTGAIVFLSPSPPCHS